MKKTNNYVKYLISILVSVIVTPTIVCLPLGLGQGHTPAFTVRKAYAATFPEDLEVEEDEENNDRTIGEVDEFILNGGTIKATYNEGYAPPSEDTKFKDVPTFYVYQKFDEAGLPIEQIDPMYFTPDDTVYYIKAQDSILKEEPDMSSITLETLFVTQQVTRIGYGDTWSMIRTEEGTEGFVLTNTLSYEMVFEAIDRTVWVDTGSLTLRKEPSVDSEVVGTLGDETKLHCVGVSAKWYEVVVASGPLNGESGYVYLSYTTTQPPPTPTPTPTPTKVPAASNNGGGGGGGGGGSSSSSSSSSIDYSKVVDPSTIITGSNPESIGKLAEAMIGIPYVYGAASASAVDCSGLVCYCYSEVAGLNLPHYSVSLCSVGVGVSRDEVQVGDIVCWDNNGNGVCGHVGIYVGNGQCVEARGKQWGVVYCSIDRSPIITIRRIYN